MNKVENIEISNFKIEDTEGVKSLILSIIETELQDVPHENIINDLDIINTIYSGDRDSFWVAKNNGQIIGTIAVKEDGGDGMIRRFFVNPNFRNMGVGRKLVDQLIIFAKKNEFKFLYFVGNSKLHSTREIMISYGFKEIEEIPLGDISIFKLQYKI